MDSNTSPWSSACGYVAASLVLRLAGRSVGLTQGKETEGAGCSAPVVSFLVVSKTVVSESVVSNTRHLPSPFSPSPFSPSPLFTVSFKSRGFESSKESGFWGVGDSQKYHRCTMLPRVLLTRLRD